MARVARRGFIVNDIYRSQGAWYMATALANLTSTNRLTLDAYRSITFNNLVTVVGTGALTITTNDGGTGGDFRFFGKGHVEFWDTDSDLVVLHPLRWLQHVMSTFVSLIPAVNGVCTMAEILAAQEALRQVPPEIVVFESNAESVPLFERDSVKLLLSMGYRIFGFEPSAWSLRLREQRPDASPLYCNDYVALREGLQLTADMRLLGIAPDGARDIESQGRFRST